MLFVIELLSVIGAGLLFFVLIETMALIAAVALIILYKEHK